MNTNTKEQQNFEHDKLTEQEKEEAKQNGFILVGKTGAGKTTILNAIFNKVMGKVEKSAISVTKESSVYYYKLTNGNVVCLIDTPGYNDSNNNDKKNYAHIKQSLTCNKYSIKGIVLPFFSLLNLASESILGKILFIFKAILSIFVINLSFCGFLFLLLLSVKFVFIPNKIIFSFSISCFSLFLAHILQVHSPSQLGQFKFMLNFELII